MCMQERWNAYFLRRSFLGNTIPNVKSADISVQVCSLQPQTSKPRRFLSNHQAWANCFHFLNHHQHPSQLWKGQSALKSLIWLTTYKKEKRKKKRYKAQVRNVQWQSLPLLSDTTGGHDLWAFYSNLNCLLHFDCWWYSMEVHLMHLMSLGSATNLHNTRGIISPLQQHYSVSDCEVLQPPQLKCLSMQLTKIITIKH